MWEFIGAIFIIGVFFAGFKLLKYNAKTTNHIEEPTSDKAALEIRKVNTMTPKTYAEYFGVNDATV